MLQLRRLGTAFPFGTHVHRASVSYLEILDNPGQLHDLLETTTAVLSTHIHHTHPHVFNAAQNCSYHWYHGAGRQLLSRAATGQGYQVHGIKRRSSSFNTNRIDHLYQDPHESDLRLVLHYGDLTDSSNLIRIIQQVQPDEIYNLGAQSHVAVSFESPNTPPTAMPGHAAHPRGSILGLTDKLSDYQASTSELYGLVQETPQKESTPFYPRSPMEWPSSMPTGSR